MTAHLAAVLAATNPTPKGEDPTGILGAFANAAEWFIGLFQAGATTFTALVTGIIPLLIVLLTVFNTVIRLVGQERVDKLGAVAGRPGLQYYPLRYLVLPVLAVFFLTNPMAYTMARFLPEKYKPAFYDSAVSFVHPPLGIFPHVNPGEYFVYAGIAILGIQAGGHNVTELAVRYLLVGLVVIFIRGIVTELFTTRMMARRANAESESEKGGDGLMSAMTSVNTALTTVSRGVGSVVGTFYQAGRDTIDTVIRNVLPFMAFISAIIGIINATKIGDWLAHLPEPLAGNLPGLLAISVFCAIPILSPLLGPGAVIAAVIGTLLGGQFKSGAIPAQYSLPALFAINPQVGCDFIPVGLALGEAEPETVEVGVPAMLFSRLLTGPLAVVIAYFASFGLYSGANG